MNLIILDSNRTKRESKMKINPNREGGFTQRVDNKGESSDSKRGLDVGEEKKQRASLSSSVGSSSSTSSNISLSLSLGKVGKRIKKAKSKLQTQMMGFITKSRSSPDIHSQSKTHNLNSIRQRSSSAPDVTSRVNGNGSQSNSRYASYDSDEYEEVILPPGVRPTPRPKTSIYPTPRNNEAQSKSVYEGNDANIPEYLEVLRGDTEYLEILPGSSSTSDSDDEFYSAHGSTISSSYESATSSLYGHGDDFYNKPASTEEIHEYEYIEEPIYDDVNIKTAPEYIQSRHSTTFFSTLPPELPKRNTVGKQAETDALSPPPVPPRPQSTYPNKAPLRQNSVENKKQQELQLNTPRSRHAIVGNREVEEALRQTSPSRSNASSKPRPKSYPS